MDKDRLPGWLWFFLALPVGFLVMWLYRRRAEEQRFQNWQLEIGAQDERHGAYDWQRREAFMGESTPADAAYSLPTAPAVAESSLATPNTGDQAYIAEGHGSRFSGSPRVNRLGARGEENTADQHVQQMARQGSVTDEDIIAGLETEDTRMEEGVVAVTGSAPSPTVEVETTDFDTSRDAMRDYSSSEANQDRSLEDTNPVRVQTTSGDSDDLKLIEGIGPAIAGLLQTQGISTFRQLADTPIERLDDILRQAEFRRLADPATWPEQARLAADGKMDELNVFQRTLKAGRRKEQ